MQSHMAYGKQHRVALTIHEDGNAPKGVGWRRSGVYSEASKRQ